MKSKPVSSSESEDSDEGVEADLEDEDSDDQDKKHTEDDVPNIPPTVVAAIPAAGAPLVLPPIAPRNTAALALTHVTKSLKAVGKRGNRL